MPDERDLVGTLHPERAARKGNPQSLDMLAFKYGTDKGPTDHNYTPAYERYLSKYRTKAITLLELGVWKGASLRMWREYLPNATIIGLDRSQTLNGDFEELDVVQIQGDQADKAVIDRAGAMYGPFDVVIDDASHISSKTIASFKLLWPHLAPGGLYVIEDLQTSYDDKHYGSVEACRVPGIETNWDRPTAMQWCKALADEVNAGLYPEEYRLGYDVASVEFQPNICFATKALA